MPSEGSGRRVAIVDDDASVRIAMKRVLEAAGFEVVVYASAEELLEDDGRDEGACLILDIHLTGMSGFDLQEFLAQSGAAPPIIFVTADEESRLSRRAQRAGCAVFDKPVPGGSLIAAVRSAIASS
jgi:FixJ family two-component response regulator